MPLKIMIGAFVLFIGWLWYFMFLRQFIYDFTTAFPMLKKMNECSEDLISPNSRRYTVVSVFASLAISIVISAIVVFLCRKHWYYIAAFGAGALISCLMTINKLTPSTKSNFEAFCNAYYRFIPDDELRTAMYNKDIPEMKARLRLMAVSNKFIPDFKN